MTKLLLMGNFKDPDQKIKKWDEIEEMGIHIIENYEMGLC